MKINMTDEYQVLNNAREIKKMRILCIDRPDEHYPVVAVDENGELSMYTANGEFLTSGFHNHRNLIKPGVLKSHVYVKITSSPDTGFSAHIIDHDLSKAYHVNENTFAIVKVYKGDILEEFVNAPV